MTKTKQQRSMLPLVFAAALIAIGGGMFVLFSRDTDNKTTTPATPTGQLQVIDGANSDPRQLQSNSSAIQGAAKVNDLMQGKEGSAVQQGQGLQQGVTNMDQLLQDKQIQ